MHGIPSSTGNKLHLPPGVVCCVAVCPCGGGGGWVNVWFGSDKARNYELTFLSTVIQRMPLGVIYSAANRHYTTHSCGHLLVS